MGKEGLNGQNKELDEADKVKLAGLVPVPMSQTTKRILQGKLEELKVKEIEAGLNVGEAGGTDDWHDNFALENAQKEQALVRGLRIETEQKLKSAVIVSSRSETDVIDVGNRVTIQYDDGESERFELRTPIDADVLGDGVISHTSPIGQAIVGLKLGESANIEAPAGKFEVTIQNIEPGKY